MVPTGSIRKVLLCTFIIATISLAQTYRIDPISESWTTSCAKTCSSLSEHLMEYQTGQTYSYQVRLSTKMLSNGQQQEQTKVTIQTVADLSVYGPCEMVLRLRDSQIDGIQDEEQQRQMKTDLEQQSTHFAYENGQFGDVCLGEDESDWTANIKRSIMSSIQMTAKTITEKSSVIERDVNGQCQTDYEPINQWNYGQQDKATTVQVLKTKQLHKCNKRHQIDLGLFPRSYGLSEVMQSSLPIVNASYECRQTIQSGIVIDSQCCDKQTIWPFNVVVDSDIRVQLIDQQSALTVPKEKTTKRENIIYEFKTNQIQSNKQQQQQYSQEDVLQLLRQICSQVEYSVQIQVPEMFARLVKAKQSLSVDDEQQLYEAVRNGQICNSQKIVDLYLDASALAGTEGSVQVLIQAYNQRNQQEQIPRFSYLFSMLAFAKYPTVQAGQYLVEFVQQQHDDDDFKQILLGVTGFIHNIRQQQQPQDQNQYPTLVKTIQYHLIEQLEKCTKQPEKVQYGTCLTFAHALNNVGVKLVQGSSDEQVQIVQRLLQIVQNYASQEQQHYTPTRMAIIGSLVDVLDEPTRQQVIQEIFMNEQEPVVIRIQAYKAVVLSGAKISQLEQIRSYVDSVQGRFDDLINYVRSHQANLRSTSDLHRRTILPLGAPDFPKPMVGEYSSLSRNYEFSYLNDVYQMGVTAEADVIFDEEQQTRYSHNKPVISIPRVLAFNLTIPIMGKEFQAVQVRIQQHGLEKTLQKYSKQTKNIDPFVIARQLVNVITKQGEKVFDQNPELTLWIEIGVDGKTMAVLNQYDLVQYLTMNGRIGRYIRNIFNQGQRNGRVSIDNGVGLIPIDFVATMTTSNGMPIQVQLNSSVVIGLKSDVNVKTGSQGERSSIEFSIWPSIAGQIEARVQYQAAGQWKSMEHKARVYSAPHVNMAASIDQGINIQWKMPEQRYTLFRYESTFSINGQSERSMEKRETSSLYDPYSWATQTISSSTANGYRQQQCTDFTKKPLGVAVCYDVNYKKQTDSYSDFAIEISVDKFDQQLETFEIYATNPLSALKWISGQQQPDKRTLKFVFNTPGSQIDRQLAFELQLPSFDGSLLNEARLHIQTPWKQMLAEAIIRNQPGERVLSVQLQVDQQQYFQMEMSLQAQKRGQKSEYKTKLILVSPVTRAVNLAGVLSYQQGRKTVLFVSLEDVEQHRQYIKATVVKTGKMEQSDLKCSAHCMIDLYGIAAKLAGTFEQSARDLKLELNTNYHIASISSVEQSGRLVLKHQNLGWGKMTKFLSQASLASTQFPEYNSQYNHQMTFAPTEYLEHDLQMGWQNEPEQIRCYQLIKVNGQRGKYDVDGQAILAVKPLKIDYQVKTQANLLGLAGEPRKRYQLIASGQSRTSDLGKFNAELQYQQESAQPLKVKVKASVKSDQIDFTYSDDIQEQQPNQYQGQMEIQMSPEHKYSTSYVYSIEKDQSEGEYRHQVDMTVNDAISKRLVGRQHTEVHYKPNSLLKIQSKVTGQQEQNLFDGQLKLDRYGRSECSVEHYPSDSKVQLYLAPYESPMSAQVQMKNGEWKHWTDIQYDDTGKSFQFKSDTKQNEQNVFKIDSKIQPKDESHLIIDSAPFSTNCQYECSNKRKSAKLQLNVAESSLSPACQHESKWSSESGRYHVNSHTKCQEKTLADIQGKYEQGDEYYLNVDTPSISAGLKGQSSNDKFGQYEAHFRNDHISHETNLAWQPKNIRLESNTSKQGKQIAAIKYDSDSDSKVHELKVKCGDMLKANAQCKLDTNEPFGNVELEWAKQAQSPFKHQTQFRANRQQQSMELHSNSKLSDEKIAQIKAAITQRGKNGQFEVEVPQFKSHLSYEEPSHEKQVKFEFDGKTFLKDLKHQTELKVNKKRSIVDLKSETKSKKDKTNFMDVKAQYRHGDKEEASSFDLKLPIFQVMGKFNPFHEQEKSFQLNGQYEDRQTGKQYRQQTKAKYWPKEQAIKIESGIEDELSNKVASIKSYLSKNKEKTSFFTVESSNKKQIPSINMELNRRMKRAAIDIDMDQFEHRSLYHDDKSVLKINTLTTKDQQNIFNFNGEYNRQPMGKSHAQVTIGPNYRSDINVVPMKRSGSFSLQTPSIEHDSKVQFSWPVSVESNTRYENELLSDVDARFEGLQGENVIKTNVPSYIRFDSTMHVPERRASFDVRTNRRHSIGSISIGQQERQFHLDFAWDVDRDPRSRVLVDINAKRQSDHSIVVGTVIDYAHNKLSLQAQVSPQNLLSNSAHVSLSYVPYGSIGSWEIIYSHLNRVPQVECKLQFLSNDQLRYSARVTNQITNERFVIGLQTTSPQNIEAQLNVQVMAVQQSQGQYYVKATLERAVKDQYDLEATINQDQNEEKIYYGNIEIRVPRSESQSIQYRIDLPGRYVLFHAVHGQTGQEFKLQGQLSEQQAEVRIKSNVPYLPVTDGQITYIVGEQFYTKLDVDNERYVELQFKHNGFEQISSGHYNLLAKCQTRWSPYLEFTVDSGHQKDQQGQQTLTVTVQARYNSERIVYGQLKRINEDLERRTITFDMQGWISRPNGVKLIETISKLVIGSPESEQVIEYIMDIVPNRSEIETIEPIYVLVNGQRKTDNTLIASIKLTHGQERRDWIDADLVVEKVGYVGQVPVPKHLRATVQFVPTSTRGTFELSIMEPLDKIMERTSTLFDEQQIQPQLNNLPVVGKYRNQILATVDDRKIGFELISTKMARGLNTYEHALKLYSPRPNGRSIQYRTAYHFQPQTFTYFYQSELKSGYEQNEPIYQSTVVVAPIVNKPSSYMAHYELRSPIILGDGQVSARAYFFGPENKYQGVMATLKTTQNQQVTFEATTRTEDEQSNHLYYGTDSQKKTYYNVSIYTQDGQIDMGIDGHLSRNGLALNYHHQNRFNRQSTGTYRFQFIGQDQFEVQIENDQHGYNARGQIRSKQDVWIGQVLIDEYEKTNVQQHYRQRRYSQSYDNVHIVTQYKLHVQAKEHCIRAELEDQRQPERRQELSICMDNDQANIVNIAVDSIENGTKTTDLNIRLDSRQVVNSMILSLKWNPRYPQTLFGQVVQRMTSPYTYGQTIVAELTHIITVLGQKFVPVQATRYQVLIDEITQIVQDFGIDFDQIGQILDETFVERIVYSFETIQKYWIRYEQQVQNYVYGAIRTVQNECYNHQGCREAIQTLGQFIHSPSTLYDVISNRIVGGLQHTHRFISTSSTGRLIRNWIPSTVGQYLPEVIHQINYYLVNTYTKMVQRNYPLAELINNIEHVVHEMIQATHWRSVQWYQVKKAVDNIVRLTLSPGQYSTSTRVLIYDPIDGQLQIELYGPAVQHPRYYQSKYNNIVDSVHQYIHGPQNPTQQQQSVWSNLYQPFTGQTQRP